jgi:type III secretion protein Q
MYTDPGDSASTTIKLSCLTRLGTRRLTRAHLMLAERPAFVEEGRALTAELARVLGEELKATVGAQARLVDSAVVPAASLATGAAYALLELSEVGAGAVLEVELPLLAALLERLSGGAGRWTPVSRLTRIEEATFGYLLLVALGAVRRQGGLVARLGPRLLGVTLQRLEALGRLDVRQRHLAVEVALETGGLSGKVRLLLPATVLQGALRGLAPAAPAALAHEVLAAGVPARCLLGMSRLPLLELMRLEPGDVVTFAGVRSSPEGLLGPARLVSPLFTLQGDFTPEGFRLSGAQVRTPTQESAMPPTSPETKERSTEVMPPLPVEVEVELARVRLSVAELAQLRPGHVLGLRINASEPVVLRIGDRAVAQAELVDIEGEVGARILSLLQ